MKAIVLVGGFATRLYPLTKDKPKALLPLGGKAVLDYIMEKLERVPEVDEVLVVGNSFFADTFEKWKNEKDYDMKIEIINDDGKDNASKPGALGGLRYALNKKKYDDEIFLLAGDNYFDFELEPFVDFYRQKKAISLLGGKFDDLEYLGKNFGVAELDKNGKMTGMEEKPGVPKSDIGLYAFYLFPKGIRQKLETYFAEGNNPDALGYFVKWLNKSNDIYCYVTKENCFDIGTVDMYNHVNNYVKQKQNVKEKSA